MNKNRIKILNCPIDKLTVVETLSYISDKIANGQQIHHTVVNAGKIVMMQDDPELHESVVSADLINADGQAVVWASKILGKPLPERVAGIDLMQSLVELASEKGYKMFFLGAKEEVVAEVVDIYTNKYSKDVIAGYRNGYFDESESSSVAQQIRDSGANILFVAINSPKKETFLYNYKSMLSKVSFIMGVGGSFDVVSGKVKRAPSWMQRIGMEWFYRFIQEPKRMWRRYTVGNYKFIRLVVKEYLADSSSDSE